MFQLIVAMQVVQQVSQMVTAQKSLVDMVVGETFEGFISQVTGGAWEGDDAESFVTEVQNLQSQASDFAGMLTSYLGNITGATEVIEQADAAIEKIADGLGDLFDAIF